MEFNLFHKALFFVVPLFLLSVILASVATVKEIRVASSQPELNLNLIEAKFTFDDYQVPDQETTYTCKRFNFSEFVDDPWGNLDKYHAVKFEVISDPRSEEVFHHLILYQCSEGFPVTGYFDCVSMPDSCEKFVWGWAPGGQPFELPKAAGFPFGTKKNNIFIMQVHYSNADRRSDIKDSSGVKFSLSRKLRENDAGILTLGTASRHDIAIPPGEESHTVTVTCNKERTRALFGDNAVTVIAYIQHAHNAAISLKTSHIMDRGDVMEESDLGIADPFDFSGQIINTFNPPRYLRGGDTLVQSCIYNTQDRSNFTYGGPATSDEMCFNFIFYYPSISKPEFCNDHYPHLPTN